MQKSACRGLEICWANFGVFHCWQFFLFINTIIFRNLTQDFSIETPFATVNEAELFAS